MKGYLETLERAVYNYNNLNKGEIIIPDESHLSKISNEIEALKEKLKELNNDNKEKTKIEEMKKMMEISSTESQITLKEKELIFQKVILKEKIDTDLNERKSEIQRLEKEILELDEYIKKGAVSLILDGTLEGTEPECFILIKPLEEVKDYYEKIIKLESDKIVDINKEIDDYKKNKRSSQIENEITRINMEISSLLENRKTRINKLKSLIEMTIEIIITEINKELKRMDIILPDFIIEYDNTAYNKKETYINKLINSDFNLRSTNPNGKSYIDHIKSAKEIHKNE